MHVYIYTYVYTHTHIYIHIHIYIYIYTHIRIHIYISLSICIYIYIYMCSPFCRFPPSVLPFQPTHSFEMCVNIMCVLTCSHEVYSRSIILICGYELIYILEYLKVSFKGHAEQSASPRWQRSDNSTHKREYACILIPLMFVKQLSSFC